MGADRGAVLITKKREEGSHGMATLMTWGDSEGIKGRCDAKCHHATTPKCECMCGGRFHGKARQPGGLEEAVEEFWDEVLFNALERAEREGLQLEALPKEEAVLAARANGRGLRKSPFETVRGEQLALDLGR